MRAGPPEVRRRNHAEYMREWRSRRLTRDRSQAEAYDAAERRVREAHRDEFERYYAEEKAKRGLM